MMGYLDKVIVTTITILNMVITKDIEPFTDDLSKFDLKPKNTSHPFLYFSAHDIPRFISAAKSTHKVLADDIIRTTNIIVNGKRLPPKDYKTFAGSWNERYGNDLPALSMYCILHPNDNKVFKYTMEYMDRLAEFKHWQTTTSFVDEIPVSHILLGFVTAFDFLYNRIDNRRKQKYISQIVNKTEEMHEASFIKWWGKVYHQNHVYTNYVAIFTASFVAERYDKRAAIWKQRAIVNMEGNMELLRYIRDGSVTESDHYHTYMTRSITQYVYLCQRHLGVDHTGNPWLSNAFWYMYGSVLPGMMEPWGFGDQHPYGWSYGCEANLLFLDKYVLKTGTANWLAFKIREHNPGRYELARSDRILSMHLEYIWYDPNLIPKTPSAEGVPTLFKYPDMGVVIFRTSSELIPNNTFLSLKSGKLLGSTIYDLVVIQNPKWLKGWASFNPGHETPDRNSFTFAPHGIMLISDGVKNFKYTYLDNTLMFKSKRTSDSVKSCVAGGWIGQIGECTVYLAVDRHNPIAIDAHIVTSTIIDNIVHFSGEAKGAYPPQLKLKSFYRNVILLSPELLLVVDHLHIERGSSINYVSSFFNNRYRGFKHIKKSSGSSRIVFNEPGNDNSGIIWLSDDDDIPSVNITNNYGSTMLKHTLHNINLTFTISDLVAFKRIAYVFHGPNTLPTNLKFTNLNNLGVSVKFTSNDVVYNVDMVTDYSSVQSRKLFLNHNGYYTCNKWSSKASKKHPVNNNIKHDAIQHTDTDNNVNLDAMHHPDGDTGKNIKHDAMHHPDGDTGKNIKHDAIHHTDGDMNYVFMSNNDDESGTDSNLNKILDRKPGNLTLDSKVITFTNMTMFIIVILCSVLWYRSKKRKLISKNIIFMVMLCGFSSLLLFNLFKT